ncbi:MAG: phosphonoacetaldehyde hydrolase [Clostridiales Family XIII bacterium]|jgi:phosphonoacetaldehyde hydrolase|nr:phosphonoacetaldehyde hydrolase [Clostridiales Family XIII bacterium]
MKRIKAVIFDWAGTTVDFGSFAPVAAFGKAFAAFGLTPTIEETRAPMGMQKRAHIKTMLTGERLSALWRETKGHPWTDRDVDEIYARFEPELFAVLNAHTTPLPGVTDTVARVREMDIRVGSTTGYTTAMMEIVAASAAAAGYAPDCLVCPDEVGGVGRPYPYMLWRNLEKLRILSAGEALKVGDTAADMQEGKNAGCLCVGVIKGSCMLGLREAELNDMRADEKRLAFEETERRYMQAGADMVIEDITALPALIESLRR